MSAATVALAAVALTAVGFVVATLVVPQPTPDLVAAPHGDATLAVSLEPFSDERIIAVTPQITDPVTLEVTDSGRVTAISCVAGGVIASGSSPATLDDRPLLALYTSTPLWRDLAVGSRGADVLALESELARLGHDLTPDDYYGQATRTAVAALQAQIGIARPAGTIATASVLWLPNPEVVVGACEVSLGQSLDDGLIATAAGGLSSLRVTGDLSDAAVGERVLQYGELSAPINADGWVTDAALLAAVAAGPEIALLATDASAGSPSLSLTTALADPLDVVVLPPSALFAIEADSGCVIADGEPRTVQIVSSALGKTMVTFSGGAAPDEVVVDPAPTSPDCR